MIDNIIFSLLTLDGNETYLIDDYYKTSYKKYKELVFELIKKKYDVRYCRLESCKCHPESKLREVIKDDELMRFVKDNIGEKLYNQMILMIAKEYDIKTVFDETELRARLNL